MSRVEEALKRAAGETVDLPSASPLHPRHVSAESSHLDRYPAEKASAAASSHDRVPRPVSAQIVAPRAGRRGHLGGFAADLEGKLVVAPHTDQISVEQYRRLAATLHDLHVDRSVRTLMITSAAPREGKTLTTTNLALTLSESYNFRVLLIDADLRRPSIHEVFGIPNATGLGDALRSEHAVLSTVEVSPHLTVLPAGRAIEDPMAGLTSNRMRALIHEAVTKFDWVLLDTPPIGLMSDANLLARLADGVLFVIGAGVTPYKVVNRAIAEIGPERIIGTVLNRADATSMASNGYYHAYYGANPKSSPR